MGFNVKKRGFEVVDNRFRKYPQKVIKTPTRSTTYSAGHDFFSPIDFEIKPKEKKFLFSDVKAYMLENEVLNLYIRSSLSVKMNIILLNSVGVIDKDYYNNPDNDGNIGFVLYNIGNEIQKFKMNDKLIQGVFSNYLIQDNDNIFNEKRIGGCGSTGK